MRLIRTTPPIQLDEFSDNEVAESKYAILSHRWEENEVSFQEMLGRTDATRGKKGYKKIAKFCKRALDDGFRYAWVDTCCINKESSAELSEAINSMFRWYQEAGKCYAFLTDVDAQNPDYFPHSVWFTRGWTLQELIAPQEMVFLANDWSEIGSRQDLASKISQRTKIDEVLLLGQKSLDEFSISKRMSWAATRKTTRAEDRAYSLMGIFKVYMPLLYGEGNNAFTRLQEEIMKDSNDETLFAWERDGVSEDNPCGLLAPSPDCFVNSEEFVPYTLSQGGLPFSLTNRGIRMESPLIPSSASTTTLILQCTSDSALVGIGIKLNRKSANAGDFVRITNTPLRDISPSFLGNSTLETIYIPKSALATSTHKPNPQAQDGDASEIEFNIQAPKDLFHRKIKPPGRFKRIILFFDDDTRLLNGAEYHSTGWNSNLDKLRKMLRRTDDSQMQYYDSGRYDDPFGYTRYDGYKFLQTNHQPGDEILLFGFGRGCSAVLGLVQDLDRDAKACIRFVGFFDAVQGTQEFRQSHLGTALEICTVRHAIGIDEKQTRLKPVMITDLCIQIQSFQEVWFTGGHQDVGGMTKSHGCDPGHFPLVWMLTEAKKMGLHFDSDRRTLLRVGSLDHDIDPLNTGYKGSQTGVQHLQNARKGNFPENLFKFELQTLHSELEFGYEWSAGHVYKQRLKNLFYSKTLSQSTARRRGQREIPLNAILHHSVLLRMRQIPTYRPSNLCIQDPTSLYVLDERDEMIEYALWRRRNDVQAE